MDEEDTVILRRLNTSLFKDGDDICPPLEAPNVVDGLAAALTTSCQMDGVPAGLFVGIHAETLIGAELLKLFECVLDKVGLSCADIKEATYAAEIMRTFKVPDHMVYT